MFEAEDVLQKATCWCPDWGHSRKRSGGMVGPLQTEVNRWQHVVWWMSSERSLQQHHSNNNTTEFRYWAGRWTLNFQCFSPTVGPVLWYMVLWYYVYNLYNLDSVQTIYHNERCTQHTLWPHRALQGYIPPVELYSPCLVQIINITRYFSGNSLEM